MSPRNAGRRAYLRLRPCDPTARRVSTSPWMVELVARNGEPVLAGVWSTRANTKRAVRAVMRAIADVVIFGKVVVIKPDGSRVRQEAP